MRENSSLPRALMGNGEFGFRSETVNKVFIKIWLSAAMNCQYADGQDDVPRYFRGRGVIALSRKSDANDPEGRRLAMEALNFLTLAIEKFEQAGSALARDEDQPSNQFQARQAEIARYSEAGMVIDELLDCLATSEVDEDRVRAAFSQIIDHRRTSRRPAAEDRPARA